MKYFNVIAAALLIGGCASNKPVIYPNAHSQAVGAAQVEADVAACKDLAESAGATPNSGVGDDAARRTVRGGGAGAASGAVGGAIAGNAGRGAAIGAASGATAGLLHSLLGRPSPNPTYRNFVERCLRDRGYDLAGWN
jgi:hypothetical protein